MDEKSKPCRTCGYNVFDCSGHFGHVDLPLPVVNPLFHKILQKLLKLSYLNCFTLQTRPYAKLLLSAKLSLLKDGLFSSIEGLEQEVMLALSNISTVNETEITYIQGIIDSYIQNVYNKERFRMDVLKKESNINTKNTNMQRYNYIDSYLKQCTAGKVCINCKKTITKITVLNNKIMTCQPLENADGSSQCANIQPTILMPDQSKEYLRKL